MPLRVVDGAMPRHVSSLAYQMRFRNPQRPIRVRKADGALIVQLGVLHLDRNICEVAIQPPLTWVNYGPLQRYRAGHRRMTRKLFAEISAPKRVQIQMIQV